MVLASAEHTRPSSRKRPGRGGKAAKALHWTAKVREHIAIEAKVQHEAADKLQTLSIRATFALDELGSMPTEEHIPQWVLLTKEMNNEKTTNEVNYNDVVAKTLGDWSKLGR